MKNVRASFNKSTVEVEFDEKKISEKKIVGLIEKAGYEVEAGDSKKNISDKIKYLFYPPGWSHDREISTSKVLQKKYN